MVGQTDSTRKKVLIFPCNGDCPAGNITWLAAQELVLENRAEWCRSWHRIEEVLDASGEESPPFIIVEGCANKCLFNALLEEGLVGKHHLALSDVGIAPLYFDDITQDDIKLAKEAILAECRPVNRTIPPLFSGCCCK